MGRLFDAVASLCNIRHEVNYEAQAAIELESQVNPEEKGAYPFLIRDGDVKITPVIRALIQDVHLEVHTSDIAARFHNTIAKIVLAAALEARKTYAISEVVLSGGVWQNMVFLASTLELLIQNQFTVYTHQKVPTNDGGVSLGQAVIAAANLIDQGW